MNKYEMTLIFKPTLEEEVVKTELEKAIGHVTRFGGTIDKVDEWGKRRLAYEIQKVNEGTYFFVYFTAPAEAPADIEGRVRIMESLLRYLIIRIEE